MIAFIDDHRASYGVEPICRLLRIAPSTYHAHRARQADPSWLSDRARRDAELRVEIAASMPRTSAFTATGRSGANCYGKASRSRVALWRG